MARRRRLTRRERRRLRRGVDSRTQGIRIVARTIRDVYSPGDTPEEVQAKSVEALQTEFAGDRPFLTALLQFLEILLPILLRFI